MPHLRAFWALLPLLPQTVYQCFITSSVKKVSKNVPPKLSLAQLEHDSSCLIACYLEEIDTTRHPPPHSPSLSTVVGRLKSFKLASPRDAPETRCRALQDAYLCYCLQKKHRGKGRLRHRTRDSSETKCTNRQGNGLFPESWDKPWDTKKVENEGQKSELDSLQVIPIR